MADLNIIKVFDMPNGLTYIGRQELHGNSNLSKLETEMVLWDVAHYDTKNLLNSILPSWKRDEKKEYIDTLIRLYEARIKLGEYFKNQTINPSIAIAQYTLKSTTIE